MGKLLKYLNRYKLQCLAVLVLLVVQALCDLALPDYTADIVDTGIMQKGVDRISPKVVSQQTLDDIKIFMTDDEQKLTEECYQLVDSIEDTDALPLKDSVPKGKVYKLTTDDSKKLEELDKALQTPVAVYLFASQTKLENTQQGSGENAGEGGNMPSQPTESMNGKTMLELAKMGGTGLKIREDFSKKMDEMSQMTVEQSAKAFVQGEYERLGVDLNSLEKSYLWKAGLKMRKLITALRRSESYFAPKFARKKELSSVLSASLS